MTETTPDKPRHFIQEAIDQEIATGRWGAPGDGTVVHTRFPPEPNGFLHIGHAKAIWINFGLAQEFGGAFNLRFDDTNPEAEETRFVHAIVEDLKWLGCSWSNMQAEDLTSGVFFASDYFQQMHDYALELIDKGLAYVDDQSAESIRAARGRVGESGTASPFRDRTPEENRTLFAEMVAGTCEDGARVLRAKIDMASPNMNLRDPVMYRVRTHLTIGLEMLGVCTQCTTGRMG